jgi:hypothetical protein
MNIEKIILYKLFRKRNIGGKHTHLENLFHGIPKHLHGEAKYHVQLLIKEKFLLTKSAFYGPQISINPEKIEEIKKIIEER